MSTATKKADLSKLAHLLEPGRVIHTMDGVYRVTSKQRGPDGFAYKLANLEGKTVPMPENFRPVTASYAKLAHWMRFVVAFNKDFDQYVKEYIKAAGLPVDDGMDWSRFFQKIVFPKLIVRSNNPEEREAQRDEAIHNLIIQALAYRKILDKDNPNGFHHKIKEFNAETQAKPLEKQVTDFLMNYLGHNHRIIDANEYIREQMNQSDADSMWGQDEAIDGEEGEEFNLLDTVDHAEQPEGQYKAEIETDVRNLRTQFEKWLDATSRSKTNAKHLDMFDLYWEHCLNEPPREGGGMVKPDDIREEWMERTGMSSAYFKVFWAQLPELLQKFIERQDDRGADTSLLQLMVKDMTSHGRNSKPKAEKPEKVHASLKTAEDLASEFFTEDVPNRMNQINDAMNPSGAINSLMGESGAAGGAAEGGGLAELGELAVLAAEGDEHHDEEITEAGLKHEDEGYYVRMVYLPNGNLQIEATENLKNEFAQNEDWNPTIYELLEDFTTNGWEWIRPEDIGALTEGDIIADSDGHIFWHERYQLDDPVEELKTAGHFEMQSGGSLDDSESSIGNGDEQPEEKTSAEEDEKAPEAPSTEQIRETEEKEMEEHEPEDFKKVIEDVIGSGLFEQSETSYFTWSGCDYEADGLGAEVYDIEGYRNLEEAHKGEEHKIEFKLCGDCLNNLYYGEGHKGGPGEVKSGEPRVKPEHGEIE